MLAEKKKETPWRLLRETAVTDPTDIISHLCCAEEQEVFIEPLGCCVTLPDCHGQRLSSIELSMGEEFVQVLLLSEHF